MAKLSSSRSLWAWPVLVPLLGILFLAGLGWREADRAQGTAELLMVDYASFIAEGFLEEAGERFAHEAGLTYDPQLNHSDHVSPATWLRSLLSENLPLSGPIPESLSRGTHDVLTMDYFFSYEPESRRLDIGRFGVEEAERRGLLEALQAIPLACPASTIVPFPSVAGWVDGVPAAWTVLVETNRRGLPVRFAGFRVDPEVAVERLLRPLIQNDECACPPSMVPESLRPVRDVRRVASFIIRDGSGGIRYQSEPQYAAARAVTKEFPSSIPLSGWTVEVRLNPEAVRPLLPYGGRSLPWPAVFVFSGLAVSVGLISLRAQRRHGELLKLREDFVANVSHELKTPLARVRLFNDLLRRDPPPHGEIRTRYQKIIDRECRRLGMLVDNVLDFARSERGAGSYQMLPLNLCRLTEEALESFRASSNPERFTLEARLEEGVEVAGDRDALQQLIINLLDNAVKHSGKGCRIQVTVETRDTRALLVVEDNGPGITEADQQRIFDPFYRAPQQDGQAASGSGLGLALVRQIVEAHKGQVWVDSRLGEGSRFLVELPRAAEDEVEDA